MRDRGRACEGIQLNVICDMGDGQGRVMVSPETERDSENPAQVAETSVDRGFARDAHARVSLRPTCC